MDKTEILISAAVTFSVNQLWQRAALCHSAEGGCADPTEEEQTRVPSWGCCRRWPCPAVLRAVGCRDRAAIPHLPPSMGSAPGEQGAQLRFGNQPRAAGGDEQPCPADPLPHTMCSLSSSYTSSCLPSVNFTRVLLYSLRVISAVTTRQFTNTHVSGSELSSCCLFHVVTQNIYGPSLHINKSEEEVMVILYKLLECLIFFCRSFCPDLHLGNLKSIALLPVTINNTTGNQGIVLEHIAICNWIVCSPNTADLTPVQNVSSSSGTGILCDSELLEFWFRWESGN